MSWKPTHRWVGSYYEVVKSETREPSDATESGYVSREFRATPVLSILNVLADRVWLYVSFYNFDGVPQLELSAEGGLDQRTSDRFRVADNVKIPFDQLGDATTGDVYQVWQGWFEIYASAEVYPDAWMTYNSQEMFDPTVSLWDRSIRLGRAPILRDDDKVPQFNNRPSENILRQ